MVDGCLNGEALQALNQRHDVCLIRIWIEKYERGAATMTQSKPALCPSARHPSRPWRGWLAAGHRRSSFQVGLSARTVAERRDWIYHHRPACISIVTRV